MQISISNLTSAAILDASPVSTTVVDAEGTVVYVNEAFLERAGEVRGETVRREDRIGGSVWAFTEHDRRKWMEIYERVLKQGESVSLEEVRSRLPDREVYTDVQLRPITREDGEVLGAVITRRDVTDRVNARRAEQRSAALDRARVLVYEMRSTEDAPKVLTSVYECLRDAGMMFDGCSVQIVQEGGGTYGSSPLDPEWVHIRVDRPLAGSLIYEAWRDQQVIYQEDLDAEDRYDDARNRTEERLGRPIRSVLTVPFSYGAITVDSVEPNAFSERDIDLLKQFSEVLSAAYVRFEDVRKLGESLGRLLALQEIDRAILAAQAPEEIAGSVLRLVRGTVHAVWGGLVLLDLEAGNGGVLTAEIDEEIGLGIDGSMLKDAFDADDEVQAGRVQVIHDTSTFPEPSPIIERLRSEEIRSFMGAPLVVQDQVFGVLYLGTKIPGVFAEEHVGAAREVAGQLAIACRQARLREQLQRVAALDRVRLSVYEMQSTADAPKVLISVYEGLQDVGVTFDACSVQIVQEERGIYESYIFDTERVHIRVEGSLEGSTVYEAWRNGKAIHREDLTVEDRSGKRDVIQERYGKPVRSVLDVPFSQGTLAINRVEPKSFSKKDVGILEQFAGVLSEAYARFDDVQKIERSAERLRILREIDQAILVARSPAAIAQEVLRHVRKLVYSMWACVMWFDAEEDEGVLLATDMNGESDLRLDASEVRESLRTGEVQIVEDTAALPDPSSMAQRLREEGIQSYIAIPIGIQDQVLGALYLGAETPRTFISEHVEIAKEVADQLAIASQQARLREQLVHHAEELEHRVADRTEELEGFAYSVSHDLRAPLRAMQGFSTALLEDYAEHLDETGQEYTRRVVAAAARMDLLIQDLLAYSRLSRAEIQLAPICLERVVEDVLVQLEAEIQESGARVTVEGALGEVLGHRVTLVQVLGNLLGNAVKFARPDASPEVRVCAETGEGRTRLWMEDNGIGIDTEHQERIFRVFERLHGVETYPGTGIGLAIVKKGMDRMEGEVGVESEVGVGSRFWIELPGVG